MRNAIDATTKPGTFAGCPTVLVLRETLLVRVQGTGEAERRREKWLWRNSSELLIVA